MAVRARERRSVEVIIARWKPRLYLSEWEFEVQLMSEPDRDNSPDDPDGETAAAIHASPTYLQALIQIYPLFWELKPSHREKVIVHELSHCLTQELFNVIDAAYSGRAVNYVDASEKLERLTQRITNLALSRAGA